MSRIVEMLGRDLTPPSGDTASGRDAGGRYQDRLITLAAMVADLIAADGANTSGGASARPPARPHELNVETWSLWKDAVGGVVFRVEVAGGVGLSLHMAETSARSLFDSLSQDAAGKPPIASASSPH